MKTRNAVFVMIMLGMLMFANVSYAGEAATFEAFYSDSVGWDTFIWAGIAATAIATIVFFTGGLASPLVAGPVATIGTMVGNIMGFYGAVATKAGLALLGGGSIASGGLGMAGGAALVTAALEFGTGAVIGYSIDAYSTSYSNSSFIEQSKGMANLPLPLNTEGSVPYEKVMEILQKIEKDKPLSDPSNKVVIETALKVSGSDIDNEWTGIQEKKLQFQTLNALLLMSNGQYDQAKNSAQRSIKMARENGYKNTLPSFIYAICGIYDENVDVNMATRYFREAIAEEPDNLLIPILFAAYLDRVVYRFTSDGKANESDLKQIALIATSSNVNQHAPATLSLIMVRYFTLLKLRQQIITALSGSSNEAIRNSPKTVQKMEEALKSYNTLLVDADLFLKYLLSQKLDDKQRQEVGRFPGLLAEYRDDQERLRGLIEKR